MLMKRTPMRDYMLIALGALLMAIGSKNIYDPNQLVVGGVTGLGIILRSWIGMPLWLSNTLLNIPLFLAAWKFLGVKFIGRTLYGAAMLSFFLWLLPGVSLIPDGDLLLAAVFGGILSGLGFGLILIGQATTGGTDILAALLHIPFPQYSIPQILQVIDWGIVAIGVGAFGGIHALYAIISVYVMTKVSNGLMEGMHYAKAVWIITSEPTQISDAILQKLDRGVTGVHAIGMYSGKETTMLYSIMSNREITYLKDLVHEIDPNAFVILSDVREVMGEGFSREKPIPKSGSPAI